MKIVSVSATFSEEKPRKIGLFEKARNLSAAVANIVKSGFAVADKKTRKDRTDICIECKFWKKDGNLGLGECTQCGCSKYKRFFESQKCPIGKW